MQEYAEKERLMSQPRRILISSFEPTNGTVTTSLLLFLLGMGLVCTKVYRFVEYAPVDCWNNFVQSAVNALRQGDENANSVLWQKLWNCLSTTRTVIKLWIVFAIGQLMQEYAEKERLMSQPRRTLISSFEPTIGTWLIHD